MLFVGLSMDLSLARACFNSNRYSIMLLFAASGDGKASVRVVSDPCQPNINSIIRQFVGSAREAKRLRAGKVFRRAHLPYFPGLLASQSILVGRLGSGRSGMGRAWPYGGGVAPPEPDAAD